MKMIMVGIGGYGQALLRMIDEALGCFSEISAAVDPFPESSAYFQRLRQAGVPVYPTLEALFAEQTADLAVIASPIPLHEAQAVTALQNGAHVLCEKPIAATLQEALRMDAAATAANRRLGIGFQWSFSKTMRRLKENIGAGLYGCPVSLKTMIAWPRGDAYYAQSGWKGRVRDDQGRWALDSIVSNATAHYLHNMFFVLGDRPDAAVMPDWIEGSLYRARPIESFDTCFLRGALPGGATFYFCASHVTNALRDPAFRYEFERAVVTLTPGDPAVWVRWRDGRSERLGEPGAEAEIAEKIAWMRRTVTEGVAPACSVQTALPHLTVSNALFDFIPVTRFPAEMTRRVEKPDGVAVDGLLEAMAACYDQAALPDEAGFRWASPAVRAGLSGYRAFSGARFNNTKEVSAYGS